VLRCIAKKVCIACSRTNKIVPLTDLNKHLYSGKSEIKVNTNNSSEKVYLKKNIAAIGELITAECVSDVHIMHEFL